MLPLWPNFRAFSLKWKWETAALPDFYSPSWTDVTLSLFVASCLNKTESLCWDFNLEMLSWTDRLLIVCDNSNLNLPPKEMKELTETTSTRYCIYPHQGLKPTFLVTSWLFLLGQRESLLHGEYQSNVKISLKYTEHIDLLQKVNPEGSL